MIQSTRTSAERASRAIARLLLAVLFLVLYGRYLVWFAPSGGDVVNQYLPYQHLVRQSIHQVELPFWNAWTFCGRPLMADIQVGVWYPPNWLHWWLPLPISFALVLAFHGALMVTGCWRLGRHWGLSAPATVLGTVLFCAAPFFTLKMSQGVVLFVYAGAWWPWLGLGVSRLVERPGFTRMGWLAVGLALSLLAGSPQITYYGWLAVLMLGLVEAPLGVGMRGRAGWARKLGWLAGAFVLAMGLTAIQTVQTFHYIQASFTRGDGGGEWAFVTQDSLDPDLLWLLVNPGFLGIGHSDRALYWGSNMDFAEACHYMPLWVLTLLVPLALWCWRWGWAGRLGRRVRLQRRLLVLSAVAMVLGLGLALGRFSPLFRLFYEVVPGFDRFRVPARLMLFFSTGAALLAALTYDRILRMKGRQRSRRVFVIGGLVVGLVLVWGSMAARHVIWPSIDPRQWTLFSFQKEIVRNLEAHAFSMAAFASVGLLAAAGALWSLHRPRRHGRCWILPVVAAVELVILALPFAEVTSFLKYHAVWFPQTDLVQTLQREHRGGRVLWLDDVIDWRLDQNQPEIYPNRLLMHGLLDARGYDPVNARWMGEWMNLLGGRPPGHNPGGFMFVPDLVRPSWLGLMGVESVVTYRNLSDVPGLEPIAQFDFPIDPDVQGPHLRSAPGLRRDPQTGELFTRLGVWRNKRFQGMAFLMPMLPVVRPGIQDPDWRMGLFASSRRAADPDKLPAETAVIDPRTLRRGALPSAHVAPGDVLEALRSGPNRYVYQARLSAPCLVGFAMSAYDGWHARVDGQRTPISRLSGAFQAVKVPAGRHEVTFTYEPKGWTLGWSVSLLAVVVLMYGGIRPYALGRGTRSSADRHSSD